MHTRIKLYSIPDLIARGWTNTAIEKFLSVEDDTRGNPMYKCAAPMRFWLCDRVHTAEQTTQFLVWKTNSQKRRAAAQAGVSTRINNLDERIEHVKIMIDRSKTDDQIYRLALLIHGGNYQGDPGEFHFSDRVAINCIRHNLTNYESLWRLTNRGETGRAAYQTLRDRVDDLIAEAYPQYFGSDAPDKLTNSQIVIGLG